MSTLHILNGDSTLHGFKQSGIDGDTLVWREVLSEGPLEADIASAHFWEARSEWICRTFDEQPASYRESVVEPLSRLSEPYDEINLWFEFDLHCQSNLLGVMNYLKQQTDLSDRQIFLICPGGFPNKPDFGGMGELNGEELAYLYDNIRLQLSEIDFIVAAEAWALYVQQDAVALEKYLNETTFWGSMHFLKAALSAHLKRLQRNTNGLNYIEQTLLNIYNEGHRELCDICVIFWRTEKIYGMGDLEIKGYLERLRDKGLIS